MTEALPPYLAGLACAAAFLAGLVDAVAGGGGLIQLPALFVLFPDAAVPALLGTNKVASISGTAAALLRYARNRVPIPWTTVGPAAIAAFAGSFGGARLATHLPKEWMRPVVVVLFAGVAVFTFLRKDFGALARDPHPASWPAAIVMGAVLGAYDGFFGPGTGTFLLFGFIGLLGLDFLGASASSKVVNVATNLAAILAFGVAGHIWWALALPMAVCNIAGSQVGSRLALANGAPFVRRLFLGVVLLMLGRMTWEVIGG
ncbi:MAG: TSUP family transporter [Pseudomonadota bacterium]|nr:TSUP family transporter [Pseudomonadota bacterium]